jgi:hypothetical protein
VGKKIIAGILLIASIALYAEECQIFSKIDTIKNKISNEIDTGNDEIKAISDDLDDVFATDKVLAVPSEEGTELGAGDVIGIAMAGFQLGTAIKTGDANAISMGAVNMAATIASTTLEMIAAETGPAGAIIAEIGLLINFIDGFVVYEKSVRGYKNTIADIDATYGHLIKSLEDSLAEYKNIANGDIQAILTFDMENAARYLYRFNKPLLDYIHGSLAKAGHEARLRMLMSKNLSKANVAAKEKKIEDKYKAAVKVWFDSNPCQEIFAGGHFISEKCTAPPYIPNKSKFLGSEPFYNYPANGSSSFSHLVQNLQSISNAVDRHSRIWHIYDTTPSGMLYNLKSSAAFIPGHGLRYPQPGTLYTAQKNAGAWLFLKYIPEIAPVLADSVLKQNLSKELIDEYKMQLSSIEFYRKMAKSYNDKVETKLAWLFFAKYFTADIDRLAPTKKDQAAEFFASLDEVLNPIAGILALFGVSASQEIAEKTAKDFKQIKVIDTMWRYFAKRNISIYDDASISAGITRFNPYSDSQANLQEDFKKRLLRGIADARKRIPQLLTPRVTLPSWTKKDIAHGHEKVEAALPGIRKGLSEIIIKKYSLANQKEIARKFYINLTHIEIFAKAYREMSEKVIEELKLIQLSIKAVLDPKNTSKESLDLAIESIYEPKEANLLAAIRRFAEDKSYSGKKNTDISPNANQPSYNNSLANNGTADNINEYKREIIVEKLRRAANTIWSYYNYRLKTQSIEPGTIGFITYGSVAGVKPLAEKTRDWLNNAAVYLEKTHEGMEQAPFTELEGIGLIEYEISVSTGVNGSISPNSASVKPGGGASFKISPKNGYQIATLTENGVSINLTHSQKMGFPHNILGINKDIHLHATFELLPIIGSALVSPLDGTVLKSTTVNLHWDSGQGITHNYIYCGSKLGAEDYWHKFVQGNSLSFEVPKNFKKLHIRLWSFAKTTGWIFNDYSFNNGLPEVQSIMLSPVAGSTLTASSSVDFKWTTSSSDYDNYLMIYSDLGHEYSSWVPGYKYKFNIPTGRRYLDVYLFSYLDGSWKWKWYAYAVKDETEN